MVLSSAQVYTAITLFERFRLAYPSGTVIHAHYCGGCTLEEVRVTHPLATVEAIEDSRVVEPSNGT